MRLPVLAALAAFALSAPMTASALDSRNPSAVLSTLVANGATGELKSDADGPYILAKNNGYDFKVNFFGCNDAKDLCSSMAYDVGWNDVHASLDQVNRWNRWTILCPTYLAASTNNPHMWSPVRGFADDTSEHVTATQKQWFSCLADFVKFTDDPEAFLASKN